MKLDFTNEQQQSIAYLAQCLIKADGVVMPEENVCWNTIALKMGWQAEHREFPAGYDLSAATGVLADMDEDHKRFALAFFTMIILADEQISPEEAEMLHTISTQAQLPQIAIEDCNSVLENYLR